MQFNDEEVQEFKTEAIDLLNEAESSLLVVERGGDFTKNYDNIFRAFHSVKGAAGMLDLSDLQMHMHKVENLFQTLKSFSSISPAIATYFLEAIDAAKTLLDFEPISFKYELPSEEKKPTVEVAARPERTEKLKDLIFIIDDEEDIIEILGGFLNKYSYAWKGFSDPQKAMSELANLNPSVILSDMRMPKMTGLDVLKQVKTFNPDIPVIFISGHLSKETLVEAISNGVQEVVEKPFKEGQVISMLVSALQQFKMWQLLNKTIDMILFQFQDLENFLKSQDKKDIAQILKTDVESLLLSRRELKNNRVIKQPETKK